METQRKLRTVAAVCALIAGLSAITMGETIYVDDDAGVPGDGSSWASAFTWLQHALAAAGAGDEIRVAQGSYRPDQGLPSSWPRGHSGDARAGLGPQAVFALKNGVALRGGFAGITADDPDARDPQRYQTVLTGDLQGNDVDLWGPGSLLYEYLRADNSVHVVGSVKTDATAVLDGFIIEAALDSALYNQGGSPQITNCVFRKGTTPGRGGALLCEGGQPTLSNCVFEQNSAKSTGGAIYVSGARLALSDCGFLGNWASREGGAICSIESDLTLAGCTFEMNAALEGGAIHQTAGTLTLVECTFEANAASNRGGAAAFAAEMVSMTRCIFARNWASRAGGAVESDETPLTLHECTVSGNTAAEGGAIYASRLTSPRVAAGPGTILMHCLFTGNEAHSAGGALCSIYTEFTILGCTFADNQAATGSTLTWPNLSPGDVPYRLSMDNCIVWDGKRSLAASSFGARPWHGTTEERPHVDVVIRYSDVQGGRPGEGNIDADPCFAAPGHWVDATNPKLTVPPNFTNAVWVDGDYHLKSQAGRWDLASESWVKDDVTSPCIDAGDPNSPVGDEPEPDGGGVNMGAYGGTAEASMSYVGKQWL